MGQAVAGTAADERAGRVAMEADIRVVVGARAPAERQVIVSRLEAAEGIVVAGTFADFERARRVVVDILPDVVVCVDSGREGDRGLLDLLAEPFLPDCVILTDGWHRLRDALPAGAFALLPRSVAARQLTLAVRATAAGLCTFHPAFPLTREGPPPGAEPAGGADPVDRASAGELSAQRELPTQRELEILQMLADGLPNKAIAAELHISPHTVKFHIASILRKFEAGSRTEAVTIGIRQGLIRL